MVGHWIASFFSWPNGSVWGNALVAVPGLVWHHRRLKRHISRTATPAAPAAAPEQQGAKS